MNSLLVPSFIAVFVLICSVIILSFIISRKYGQSHGSALREAIVWGICFMVFAGIDYLMIVPGTSYSLMAG